MEQNDFLKISAITDVALEEAINATDSHVTAIGETRIVSWGQQLNARFIQEAHTRHTSGGWSWMRKTDNFQTKSQTNLTSAISKGALTFVLDAEIDSDTSGRMVMETNKGALDFVDWESNVSTTYTVSTTSGDDLVTIAHGKDKVEKLYELPSDYAKTMKLLVGTVPYFPSRDSYGWPTGRFYTQHGNFIMFSQQIGTQDVTHYYSRKAKALTSKSDTTEIPRQLERWAIEMTLFHVFRIRRKRADAPASLELANEEMERFLQYDQSFTTNNSQNGIRTR